MPPDMAVINGKVDTTMKNSIIKLVDNKKITMTALLFVILLLFSNSLSSEFVWDDTSIMKKQIFTDWRNIGTIMTVADTATEGDNTSYYRPLTYLTFLWDYQMWKLKPFWYNLENVLLHALVSVLLFQLISRVSSDNMVAFISALFFAVHPAVTEPVNFIAGGRNTMLCAAFTLGALLCVSYSARGRYKWAVFSVISYFFALLSKEQAIMLPVFLLCVALLGRSQKLKVNKYLLTGVFAVTGAYLILRSVILGSVGSEFDIHISYEQMKIIASALFGYFRIMFYPMNLSIEYVTMPLPLLSYKAAAAASLMIMLIYGALRRDTDDLLRLAAIWLVLSFLPISNIIPLPSAPVADRFLYMPLLGMSLAFGYGVKWFYVRSQLVTMAAFAIFIIMAGTLTYARNFVWQTEESLWMDVVKKNPAEAIGYYNLGVVYGGKGMYDRAEEQYLIALEKKPDHVYALLNLGIVYHSKGHVERAIGKFKDVIDLKPDLPQGYYNMGLAYHSKGQFDKAIKQYKKAISLKTGYAQAYNNMGSAYKARGDLDEAIKNYKSAIQANPRSASAHNNLGSVYQSQGLINKAIEEYKIAIALDPGHEKAIANLRFVIKLKDYLMQQKRKH
jgi:tetratricopeptide (TPR) repeat protein